MPETEDVRDDEAGDSAPGQWMTPEDAVAREMMRFPSGSEPNLERLVSVVDFHGGSEETPEQISERANRIIIFLRSMTGDYRQRFPRAFQGVADAALKAHIVGALRRMNKISRTVRDAVLRIIDTRCKK